MGFNYKVLSFLLRGKRRKAVLFSLRETKMPKQIADDCKISISNASSALAELKKKGLIKCITPTEHIYKFYKITEKGKEAIKQLEEYKNKNKK